MQALFSPFFRVAMSLEEQFKAAADEVSNKINKTMTDEELKEVSTPLTVKHVFSRPGVRVAGAVLLTALSLIQSWFLELYCKHCQSQTGSARQVTGDW